MILFPRLQLCLSWPLLAVLRRAWPQVREQVAAPLGEMDAFLARCREAGAVVPEGVQEAANLEEGQRRWAERRDAYVRAGMVSD